MNINEIEIAYQLIHIPSSEAKKVFDFVENKQGFLEHKKSELHSTFGFFGFKNPRKFGDEGIFPFSWIEERKEVKFIVTHIGNDGEAQGVFLEFHESTDEKVKSFYENSSPLHLTVSLEGKTPAVKTGLISERYKEEVLFDHGEQLIVTGYVDVFTKRNGLLSQQLK